MSTARVADLDAQAQGAAPDRHHRHLAHALGDARRAVRGQRASALVGRRDRGRAQRHHRELRSAARTAAGAGLRVQHADRQRDDRASRARALAWRGASRICCAPCSSAVAEFARRVRDRGDLGARAGPRRRRAAGSPLVVGIGDDDHFLASDAAALVAVTRRVVYLEEGDVADVRREGYAIYDAQGQRVERAVVDVRGVGRCGRARPVSPFHAEGDLRAAARRRRHARGRRAASTLRCSARRPPRPAAGRLGADPRLRHELLLEPRRQAVDRDARRHAVHGRDRERVPLSRQRAEPEGAGGRRVAVGRDRRHAGGAQAREVARPRAHARDLQRRDELDGAADGAHVSHARRHRVGVASTKAFTTQLVAQFLLALTLAKLRGRLSDDGRGEVAASALRHLPAAHPGRARARAASHGVGAGVREKAARAVPRARPALSDRARRRAQAQGNLVHPRRGVPGRRAEARAARAGRCADAGGRHRAQRRAAREAQDATCRKCARAAASSTSSPISTAI